MGFPNVLRDVVLTTVLTICVERVFTKFKHWWYHKQNVDIDHVHIDFVPERTEDETVIITTKNHNPKLFKYLTVVK